MKARGCVHSDPPCRSCINRRNRKRGGDKQRLVFDILEIPVKYRGQRANEEEWTESPVVPGFRWEVKSGRMPALVRNAIFQVESQRAVGSTWAHAIAVIPEDSQEPYAFIPLRPLVNLCKDLAEMGQGARVRNLVRQAGNILREIEGIAR